MALTDGENGGIPATMLVSPSGMGGFAGNNNGFGGCDGWWILLLILLCGNNGWGNGFGGGNGFAADGAMLYPWMNQAQTTNDGFRDQMMNDNVTSIRDSIGNLSTQMCGGFGDVQMALCNGFAGVEQGANARQMADMQQNFASQTAITGAISNLASQQASCCCENRLATCQTQNIIQNEGNQTRFADANNTRDIIQSQTAGTQAILDKLCQLELDGVKAQVDAKNDRINELQTQLNMANLAASQQAQNAFIANGFANEVDQLYNRLNNCPVPTTPVYGRTPIFTCNSNNGCGCGCSGNF